MQDPKENLRELAAKIEALIEEERRLLAPRISPELGEWFVQGVSAYLSGKGDLEKTLGLKRGPGAPKRRGKNYERAKKIFWMRGLGKRPNKSWSYFATEFSADPRTLQRELERYTPDIIDDISGELLSRLSQLPSGTK
jgi:hypothetical protein